MARRRRQRSGRNRHTEGPVASFEELRRRCIDHLRALLSIRLAHEAVATILAQWATVAVAIASALHSAAVISYSRPFTPAFTKHGKVKYSTAALRRAPGFDRELHSHLLDVRNRIIAHADYGVFQSTMYLQTLGDEGLPVALGANVKCMAGVHARSLAERYERHLRACMIAIEATLNEDFKALAEKARQHPAEFHATHNVALSVSAFRSTPEFAAFPEPTGPASGVADPTFPNGLNAYRYLTLQHQTPLITSGTYTLHQDGVPAEITFEVHQSGTVGGC